MGASTDRFDLVILGGGSGGYACALRGAQLGLSVALVEKAELGGTCLHRGCVPTKALLHAAEVADTVRRSSDFGIASAFEGVDLPAVQRYRDKVVGRLYKGLQGLVRSSGVCLVEGEGRLSARDTVQVGSRALMGGTVVLATGSRPRVIPGIPIGGRVMTSDQALKLTELPKSVVVLGGGVIGVEFASIFRSFGGEVSVVEALPRLVAAEDQSVSAQLERAFRRRGISVRTSCSVTEVEQDESSVRLLLDSQERISADLLLVSVGREPVTDNLGYEEVGVAMDRGFVLTDEYCRTNVPGVLAVGDIVPGLQLAHRGFAQGMMVAEIAAGNEPSPISSATTPRVTYSDPEIASVGLSEIQARDRFGSDSISCYEYNLGGNGKSQILATGGFVKVVRQIDGPVVGVHMVGARMGEQVGEAMLVVGWEAMPEEVAAFIHAHPTQNEALGEAHLALAGMPLHAHS
ncbi:dihydrolipoamide dehydrogenase [Austwickia chelonae]|uniref:Dihydrolipoyl dehydrogenase n=1 Tax=Austwickia chelonae NBRC 105200 TaxID=1184607 RepID=K6VPF7_9MICO|nr:dihydrolipoyl dehydrogenase [Austwickia chelonae]GAB77255.1 dihydrolipoamide dehydrogenase [Austwickia chelonae NBRC 105200]SEW06272.1 dihydrolipoamide dehydrogenase [Austwickia chelonae]